MGPLTSEKVFTSFVLKVPDSIFASSLDFGSVQVKQVVISSRRW